MNMNVSLDVKRVVAPSYLPVQSLTARLQVENGRAIVHPLDMCFGGGKVAGEFSVDAATANPTSRVNLRLDGVELAAFSRGRLRGRIVLASTGRSLARSSADGAVSGCSAVAGAQVAHALTRPMLSQGADTCRHGPGRIEAACMIQGNRFS